MGPWIREDPRIIDPGPCATSSAVLFDSIDDAANRGKVEKSRILGGKVYVEDRGKRPGASERLEAVLRRNCYFF